MSSAVQVRRRRGTALDLGTVETWLLRLAWAALVVVAALALLAPSLFDLPSVLAGENAGRLAAAIALYALSHVARLLRLALLVVHPGLRLRRVIQVHLLTTGLGVVLPFKLAELVRIREIGVVTGSLRRGILTVWLERTFDACFLLLLIALIAIDAPSSLDALTSFLVLVAAFVGLTVVLITVLPENLRGLMLQIVRRPFGERSVLALRLLRGALATLQEAPALVRGKLPTLLLLSAAIWTLEVLVVAVAIPDVALGLSGVSAAMLSLLSSISSGTTALSASFGDRLADALEVLGSTLTTGTYRACLAVSALVAGAVAASYYVPWRTRRSQGEAR